MVRSLFDLSDSFLTFHFLVAQVFRWNWCALPWQSASPVASFSSTCSLSILRFYNGGLLFSSVTFTFIACISLYSFLLLVKTKFVVSGSFGGKYTRSQSQCISLTPTPNRHWWGPLWALDALYNSWIYCRLANWLRCCIHHLCGSESPGRYITLPGEWLISLHS